MNRKPPLYLNCSPDKEFTQIPNELIRNKNISSVSFKVLSVLLSYRNGWNGGKAGLSKYMKEGRDSLTRAISALEESGYVLRLSYHHLTTKKIAGMVWAYSNIPDGFDIDAIKANLEQYGYGVNEPNIMITTGRKTGVRISRRPINKNENETFDYFPPKGEKESHSSFSYSSSDSDESDTAAEPNKIKPTHFELFWKTFPNKSKKGYAKKCFEKLCTKKDRPTLEDLLESVKCHRGSKQWQTDAGKYIPHASTYLNNYGWLDDPGELYNDLQKKLKSNNGIGSHRTSERMDFSNVPSKTMKTF